MDTGSKETNMQEFYQFMENFDKAGLGKDIPEQMMGVVISRVYPVRIKRVIHYVNKGWCDGIPTMWITRQKKWDKQISVAFKDGEVRYSDTNGDEILVFEPDEEEWDLYAQGQE